MMIGAIWIMPVYAQVVGSTRMLWHVISHCLTTTSTSDTLPVFVVVRTGAWVRRKVTIVTYWLYEVIHRSQVTTGINRCYIYKRKHGSITTLSSKTILQQSKTIVKLFIFKEQVIIYKKQKLYYELILDIIQITTSF